MGGDCRSGMSIGIRVEFVAILDSYLSLLGPIRVS